MCGIVGLVDFSKPPELADVERAADRLASRGPDSQGSWHCGPAALAHRRLSVIDLSVTGHQPMVSSDGRFVIVYNGEIYNYRELRAELHGSADCWNSDSDTETILAAYAKWGTECLSKFHGMFAFALWDRDEQSLFVARDRIGVKPLYYRVVGQRICLASRPRALWTMDPAAPNEIDSTAMRLYLEAGYIPAPHSIFRSVRKLEPAHFLVFNRQGIRTTRYWDFRQIKPELSWLRRTEDDLLDELDEVVSRSVRQRMVSDVPVGAFLSGGIDSSLVVAMMQKYSSHAVRTFTIGFSEPGYDESGDALAIAQALDTKHHCDMLEVDQLIDLMPRFAEHYDEPFFDSSAFPTMAVARSARNAVKVSLSGDGGDELFGGYHYYTIAEALRPAYALPHSARTAASTLASLLPSHRAKLFAAAMRQSDALGAFAFARSVQKDFASVIRREALDSTQSFQDFFRASVATLPKELTPAEIGMRFDLCHTLPEDYLQKVDVASMAFSLEARDPLLDHDLVTWSMRLPLSWKLRRRTNKYLLRKLAYRYVPQRLLDHPKRGFAVPIDRWLRGPLRVWAREILHDRSLFELLPLDQAKALALFDLHLSGKRNVHPLLWAVLMLLGFVSAHRSAARIGI
jgi:asparagine synthase (glutamine-hydrolysing)